MFMFHVAYRDKVVGVFVRFFVRRFSIVSQNSNLDSIAAF
jgi:hypothetical protein